MQPLDTLILGGGAAGLNAARVLQQAGRKIFLLEARDRLGGRVHTLHPSGTSEPVELGGEFVHGLPPETLALLDPVSDLVSPDGEYLVVDGQGTRVDPSYFNKILSIMDELQSFKKPDVSFAKFVEQHRPKFSADSRSLACDYVEGYHAANINEISTKTLAVIEKEGKENKVVEEAHFPKEGWGKVIEQISKDLKSSVLLNSVARKISWKAGSVSIEYLENGQPKTTPQAKTLLVTLPIGVLQASADQVGAVVFSPDLDRAKKDSISKLKMGEALRVVYQFKKPFWNDLKTIPAWVMLFDLTPGSKLRTWWPRGNLLTGWIGGPRTHNWTDFSDSSLRDYGVGAISRFFGVSPERVGEELETIYFYDWNSDPYSRGVYNFTCVGGLESQRALAQPVDSTLFFAGEATQPGGYSGTVNGALISGARAAHEILKTLRKNESTV